MLQIPGTPADRNQRNAKPKRQQIKCRQRRIFPPAGHPRERASADCNQKPRDQAPEPKRRHGKPRNQEGHRNARQGAMGKHIGGQAHPAQHQENAKRRCCYGKGE